MKTFPLLCRFAAILALLAAPAMAQHAAQDAALEEISVEDALAITKAIQPSLVRVAYHLRYDKGEAPTGLENLNVLEDGASLIHEERPLEIAGYLVSDQLVVTADLPVHPRFIERIAVRQGDSEVAATPQSYALRQEAKFLRLAAALPGAVSKPLTFDPKAADPLVDVTYASDGAVWNIAVTAGGAANDVITDELGRQYRTGAPQTLTVARDGKALALNFTHTRPLDDSWIGLPTAWPAISPEELDAMLKRVAAATDNSLLRVTMQFRSPANDDDFGGGGLGAIMSASLWGSEPVDPNATEMHAAGVLVSPDTVLVLESLPPAVTARLESITVHRGDQEAVTATFSHSLRNWGALLVKLNKPLARPIDLTPEPIVKFDQQLLLGSRLFIQGESRTAYHWTTRMTGFHRGFRNHLFPMFTGEPQRLFVFDRESRLITLPMQRRLKTSVKADSWDNGQWHMVPAAMLRDILAHLDGEADSANIPLTEDQERRVAWMGVELQPLDRELARLNKIAHVTLDGQIGAVVTYVYPGSPAAKQGIATSDVLVRLHVKDEPKPIDVTVGDAGGFDIGAMAAPEQGDLTAEDMQNMPPPWPSAENPLNRTLTELGAGRAVTVEYYRAGKASMAALTVELGPPHFNAAPRHRSETLGLTVRDMTYEVRRFYQKQADDPGVIVSRVEPGQKAAVAGILPYEIITHIGGQPVKNMADFQKLITDAKELRFTVERLRQARQVVIRLD